MMVDLRQNAPDKVGGEKVIKKIDYQSLEETDLISGTSEKIDFPKSNVLQFLTEKGTKISARPSGTEPKIKFYFSVNTPLDDKSKYDEISGQLDEKIDRIIADLNLN
jgi:phosphoglucomutase